jgi:cytochrome c553
MVPRLAGQHHDYLLSQLQRLQLGLRFSDTMHPTLKAMSDAQASAIAVYLAKN